MVLAPEQVALLQYAAANGEFGLRLADTMVEWGQKHISLLDAQNRSSFLQQASYKSNLLMLSLVNAIRPWTSRMDMQSVGTAHVI